MSKPVLDVQVETVDGQKTVVRAVVDSGSYFTIIRDACLPASSPTLPYKEPKALNTAGQGGAIRIVGATQLVVTIGDRVIQDDALISPDLRKDMLIGAKTMQAWEIAIHNTNGKTRVVVGKDLRDPDVQEVD